MPLSMTDEDEVRNTPLLSLGGQADVPHTEEFNAGQAAKLHLSLGEQSPGVQELSSALSIGNAEDYRRLLVDKDRIRRQEAQNDLLSSIIDTDPRMITPETVATVQGLSIMQAQDPDTRTIIEREYSKFYTNTATASLKNGIVEEAMAVDQEGSLDLMDRAEGVAFKKNYAKTVLDTLNKEDEDRGIISKGADFVERMIPFVEWYQKQNAVAGAEDFTTSILPGSNLIEQYSYMWGLPAEEFAPALDQVIAEMKDRNLYTAQSWLEGLFSYGSSDAALDNLLGVTDVADTAAVPLSVLRSALKGVVKGASKNPEKLYDVTKNLGKYDDSAVGKIVEDLGSDNFFNQNIKNIQELENSIPSIASPLKLLDGEQNIPQAAYTRLKEGLLKRADLAQKFLFEPNQIDRATPDELLKYRDILAHDYKKEYPSIQKNVLDIRVSEKADVGNVYQAVISLGHRDGTLFESRKQAENYFKRYIGVGKDDFQIRSVPNVSSTSVNQIGEGFVIDVIRNVDETKFMSDLHLGTTQRTPESLANTFLGLARSPQYTVSPENSIARSVAVTSSEMLGDILTEMAEPFRRLGKKDLSELQDLMVDNRTSQKYFENVQEFDQAFYDRFKKRPTVDQTDTYFAYVQINDLDLAVRDLDVYKQKARLGIEEITVRVQDEKGVFSDNTFEGKVVPSLPYGSSDRFSVSFVKGGIVSKPTPSQFMGEKFRQEVQSHLDRGFKIVQVADQRFKVGDRNAGFLITDDLRRSRVGVQNIGRKAGGHKVHKYPFYVKQGKITRGADESFYSGDVTLFNARTEKEAREFVDILNTARDKLRNNDLDAMKFIRDNLPISTREFMNGVVNGQIDLSVPFAVTKKGSRSIDTGVYSDLPNLVDTGKNEHNLNAKIMGRYLGERDTTDIDTIRSEGDTLFQVDTAPYLSPLDTLRQSSTNMISVRQFNDYTIKTHTDYIREFSDILEGTREEQLSRGLSDLLDPRFKSGADASRVAAAKNVSRAYKNLLNLGTPLDQSIEMYKDKLLSSVLPRLSSGKEQWVTDRLLPTVRDPGKYMRSVAFNMKMGFFNVKQLLIQANQLVSIASIGGVNGLRGGATSPIFRAALLNNNPDVLKGLANSAERIGLMKSDQFLESLRLYRKSGFNHIGMDTSYLDDIKSPEIRRSGVRNVGKAVLNWGRTPFQEGERIARMSAWNTAYLEVRGSKKGALTRRDEAMILSRAKLLAGDMTRESNASWQKGYAAVVTQFFGYQARIMEQFLGKRLTRAEKLRLFAGYSAAYGVPTAVGAYAGVIPIRDIVLDTMTEMGLDPNDPLVEPFLDGFVSAAWEYIGGDEKNISDRYGPGGIPTFYDLWRQDKDFADLALGASGGIGLQTVADSWPIIRAFRSEFMDEPGGLYNLTADDMIAPFRNISTIDDVMKVYNVWNLQRWASKNEVNLMEMDLPDALTAALTGLQPAVIEQGYSLMRAGKAWKEEFKSLQKGYIRDFRRAMKVESGPERERLIRDIKARMELSGFSAPEAARTWKYANDMEMMVDSVFEQYEKELDRKKRVED